MAKSIQDSELVVIQGAGHMAPFERPTDVAMSIREFISKRILGEKGPPSSN